MSDQATSILSGPEYFRCERLSARLTARACLLNQGKADGFRKIGYRFMGAQRACLDCPQGREMVAYPPGVADVLRTCKSPPTPRRPKKLPVWLKDATPAVRRDYLKSFEEKR